MRPIRISLALLFVTIVVCCTQVPEGSTTGSGGSSGGGSPGVAPSCEHITFVQAPVACQDCFYQECCAELGRCAAAGEAPAADASAADGSAIDHSLGNTCLDCYTGYAPESSCGPVEKLVDALRRCSEYRCQHECYPSPLCYNGENGPDDRDCLVAPEPDGAVTAAECLGANPTVLRGTLNGKPFEQTFTKTEFDFNDTFNPFYFRLSFPDEGHITLYWETLCLYTNSSSVPVTGTVQLPNDGGERSVKTCSQLWDTYDKPTKIRVYRFNLLLTGGQITGCTQ